MDQRASRFSLDAALERVRLLPEYAELIRARRRIIWPLVTVVITVYFALILSIAFAPSYLGVQIGQGSLSLGIVLGLSMILFCLVITGVYVFYANRVLEPLARKLREKSEDRE